jgi:hypothetical protein
MGTAQDRVTEVDSIMNNNKWNQTAGHDLSLRYHFTSLSL